MAFDKGSAPDGNTCPPIEEPQALAHGEVGIKKSLASFFAVAYFQIDHASKRLVSRNMTAEQEVLWDKIRTFELDDPTVSLTFTDRLARENGWKLEYALRAVDEYKKFMFLLCVSDHPLTPSDQVDQVWHLHLLYTQSYWIDFCKDTINKPIHHGPTKGGTNENSKFTNWYEKTKQLYKSIFDYDTPDDLWPPSKIRFSEINFQRVNLDRNWVFKKPFILKK